METLPILSPIAKILTISVLYLYNFGLNLQQLIALECPINIFFISKSSFLERFTATFNLLSSRLPITKLLKSGDQSPERIYRIGFNFTFEGDKRMIFYLL
jgi:hypothetical protein